MTRRLERVLIRMAQATLPRGDREWMAGDLEEEFGSVRELRGGAAAVLWLAAETLRNVRHAVALRAPRLGVRTWLPHFHQDLRYAARMLQRTPGFTATIVVTLALGIGANALVFAVVNGLLLRPLPVTRPDRLVFLQGSGTPGQSYPNYADLRDRNAVLDGLIAYRIAPMSVESPDAAGAPARRWGYLATGNYFEVLGVRPAAGRFFAAADDGRAGAAPFAVISYDEWIGRYGGDPRAIGSTIRINTFPFTIIGVAPRGFFGTERFYRPAIWVPMMMQAQVEVGNPWLDNRQTFNLWVVGRLKDGVTATQAQGNLNAIAAQLARDFPWPNRGMSITLAEPGLVGSALGTPARAFTLGIQSLAALVLLAACVNLASLLAARGSDRRREMAIRASIGAGRGRLVRQLLTESLLLVLAGGAAGAALAWSLSRALSAWRPPLELPIQFDVAADPRVLAFACAVSAAAGVLFGIAPAVQASRADQNAALKGFSDRPGRRWSIREGLVAVQMALCVVLVSACLLSVRGLQHAVTMPLGFEPNGVTVAAFDLGLAGYDRPRGEAFQRQVLDAVRQLPGVEAAAYSNTVPLSLDQSRNTIYPEGADRSEGRRMSDSAVIYQVSPGFFQAIGMHLAGGRDFDWHDTAASPRVAIVNGALARQILGTSAPIGRRFRFGPGGALTEIVAVVEDAKYQTLTEAATPAVFVPMLQWHNRTTVLTVRSSAPPAQVDAIRQAIAGRDPSLPVYDARPMREMLGLAMFPSRAAAVALSAFGLLALSLAVTGLFGLVSYAVARREREIGIRMAIGAAAPAVLRLILGRTAVFVAAGAAVGAIGSRLLARVLSSIVYTASTDDPLVMAGVVAAMIAVGVLSCWAPAVRAIRISPTAALKAE